MPKDYKDTPASRVAPPSRVNHPMLLGVIIGLLLGIVISLAVALWLNRLANPFVEKSKAPEPLPRIGPAQPAPPPETAKAAEQAAKKAQEKPSGKNTDRPRFEFYQILPGEREVTEKEAKAAPPKVAPAAPKPGSSPLSPKPHSGEVFWLQAGAFSEEREADNLKAKIALVGLEASVRPVNIPEKGTLFRVRLGPYQSLDDANRIKSALSQNGVGAAIIRVAEEAKPQ